MPEPWLRSTHTDAPAIPRQIVHALELTIEDCEQWCAPLASSELQAQPHGLPSVAFQMRHIVRSLDRLLTYAEDRPLTEDQLAALRSEHEHTHRQALLKEFHSGIHTAIARVLAATPATYDLVRHVGRDRLPTTLGGLFIHCAEHTQRHSGQMITTAKLLLALRTETRHQPPTTN